MFKFFVLFLFLISNIFAYDSTVEIVKKLDKKRSISVTDASQSTFSMETRLIHLIVGDLKVTTNFQTTSSGGELQLLCNFAGEGDAIKGYVTLKTPSKVLYKKSYSVSRSSRYPFLAHSIVVDLNNFFHLPTVDWMKKYVIFAKYTSPGKSSIVISDFTLNFQKTIVSGGLNIFPKWANKQHSAFYYTSYSTGIPTLYYVDVYSGSKRRITTSSGMLVCSDVSEDGSKLLLTMAPDDQPDIYLYDVNSGSKRRLTSFKGIDVGGNFVDNGARVVFVSDRLGYPNIFSVSSSGGRVSQMVYHGRNNSSCSTFGKYIVYSSRETSSPYGENTFNLFLISTQTDSVRKLTASGKNLYPRFGDDGETVMFIKHRGGGTSLGVLRLNANRTFLFPLNVGKIQSMDW